MFKIDKFRENQEKTMLNLVKEKKCLICSLWVRGSRLFFSAMFFSLCGDVVACVLVIYKPPLQIR